MATGKRVFKFKTFDRWAKGILSDDDLCGAAKEVEQGSFEADLGGGVCKKRVAPEGRGKSGGTRLLIAHQNAQGIFFLVGREKSEPGKDFPDKVVVAAKVVAKGAPKSASELKKLLDDGTIKEICDEPEDEPEDDDSADEAAG